jgi:membrane protein
METEAHVYALAISASVLLAFFPFITVMISLCRDVFHWQAAEQALYLGIGDIFGGEQRAFMERNLINELIPKLHLTSMLLLLFTANGIFEPLEVALNRAWGVAKNRSYLKNQVISLGLIFVCGGLVLASLILTALNSQWLIQSTGWTGQIAVWFELLFFKIAALPISILALFLVYWLLPNRKVDPRRVIPVAIVVGLTLEAMKYLNLLFAPMLVVKLHREYHFFEHSVAILLMSFVAALIVLAGAHWTANHEKADPLS